MNQALTHFYWYGYAAMFLLALKEAGVGDWFGCAIVALTSWGGVVAFILGKVL